jgi:hypothetical protein
MTISGIVTDKLVGRYLRFVTGPLSEDLLFRDKRLECLSVHHDAVGVYLMLRDQHGARMQARMDFGRDVFVRVKTD